MSDAAGLVVDYRNVQSIKVSGRDEIKRREERYRFNVRGTRSCKFFSILNGELPAVYFLTYHSYRSSRGEHFPLSRHQLRFLLDALIENHIQE